MPAGSESMTYLCNQSWTPPASTPWNLLPGCETALLKSQGFVYWVSAHNMITDVKISGIMGLVVLLRGLLEVPARIPGFGKTD